MGFGDIRILGGSMTGLYGQTPKFLRGLEDFLTAPPLGIGGIDIYTKLMLHMNGANGSNSFTDSSQSAKTVTANGNSQISTAQSKFDGACGVFDGNGDYLSFVNSDDFSPGTGPFTIDCWVRLNGYTAFQTLFDMRTVDSSDVNNFALGLSWLNSNGSAYLYGGGGTSPNYLSPNLVINTWYHIAIVGNGGADGSRNIKAYINGVLKATSVCNYNLNKNTLRIGSNFAGNGGFHNGFIDEFRFSTGIQRWTSDFTPPDSPYYM